MAGKFGKLTTNESTGIFTHWAKFSYTDLVALTTATNQQIATIPAGGAMALVMVHESIAFAGTTTLVVNIGTTSGDPDEFIDGLDVPAMTVPVFNTGDAMVKTAATTTYEGGFLPVGAVALGSTTAVYFRFADAAIGSATAGELTIGMTILDLERFAVNG